MAKFDYDFGVIGGGAAGLTATAGAARFGAKTLLIEKEAALGGDCLHYGCVPSKTLISAARVYHLMKNGPAFGLPAFAPPAVDFRAVSARIKSVIATIQQHDSVERFSKLGARVEFGSPEFSDEHSLILNGKKISARSWLIATGSSPEIPAIEGLKQTPYLTNREIFSLKKLPESMLILGAGPIAIEMAQAFARLGTKVTVIQRSGRILSKEDPDMADLLMAELQKEGIVFALNCAVLRVLDAGGQREVLIRDQTGASRTLAAEALLVALGRSPNTAGLGLEKIGLAVDRQGIKVDRRLRATHRHIYAAGDVIGGYQFTHVAGYEGSVAVSNAILHLPRKSDYRLVPWCTYCEPGLSGIGLNEKRARAAGLEYSLWSEEFAGNDRALAHGESAGRIKLLLDKKERPLGVQILGPQAGELLGEWVATMNGGVGLAKIASAIHPYPTLGEINKKIAGSVFAAKIFSPAVRRTLKFFFRYQGE